MRQDQPKTPSGNLKQPTRQDVIDWVSQTWSSIKKDTLMHSFLVCGISNALHVDGSQDDLVSSDIPNIEEKMRKVKVQSLLRKRMLMAWESHLAMKIPLVMMNIKLFFCDVLYSTCYYAIMT